MSAFKDAVDARAGEVAVVYRDTPIGERLVGREHDQALLDVANRIEIFVSVLQLKAITPNNFAFSDDLATRLGIFEQHYEAIAEPFEWKFSHAGL
ncbi:MAG: hypothetical protein OXC19_17585 [Bryobacterales bacterium]|nr:hypothetical protein [Bryobacterales bacterium]